MTGPAPTTPPEGTAPPDGAAPPTDAQGNGPADPPAGEPETFDRAYVERIRQEAADARVRAGRADELTAELLRVTIETTAGPILWDPSDLPAGDYLDAVTGLPDADLIRQTAEQLAAAKPHLARVRGDAGQGPRGAADEPFSLAGALRAAAG